VAATDESQLRRFDRAPLIAAGSSRPQALGAAVFAKLCQQGFATVRAAGPAATQQAMLAAAEARRKLLGCGLDLAVVPANEFVDVESLSGPAAATHKQKQSQKQYDAWQQQPKQASSQLAADDELPHAFVRVTLLHIVRCETQQPGRLLPWPVPAEQLPAATHAERQAQRSARQQQQQQQQVVAQLRAQPATAAVSAAAASEPVVATTPPPADSLDAVAEPVAGAGPEVDGGWEGDHFLLRWHLPSGAGFDDEWGPGSSTSSDSELARLAVASDGSMGVDTLQLLDSAAAAGDACDAGIDASRSGGSNSSSLSSVRAPAGGRRGSRQLVAACQGGGAPAAGGVSGSAAAGGVPGAAGSGGAPKPSRSP
jgi:stage V sporulation protein SpoVS